MDSAQLKIRGCGGKSVTRSATLAAFFESLYAAVLFRAILNLLPRRPHLLTVHVGLRWFPAVERFHHFHMFIFFVAISAVREYFSCPHPVVHFCHIGRLQPPQNLLKSFREGAVPRDISYFAAGC